MVHYLCQQIEGNCEHLKSVGFFVGNCLKTCYKTCFLACTFCLGSTIYSWMNHENGHYRIS